MSMDIAWIDGIYDTWTAPAPPTRRCECGTILSRYNHSEKCFACGPETQIRVKVSGSECGLRGVYRCGKMFKAQRQINGLKKHLGVFNTAEEAHEAWKKAGLKEK